MTNFWKTLPKPFLVLAPMEDVTDVVFREIVSQTAPPDVYFTEFTNTDGLFSKGGEKVIRSFRYTENQRPVVAQIWGTNPETFLKAGKLVHELKFDGIDINFGCPEKNVIKKSGGAGIIKDLKLAKQLINATRQGAENIPLSVKTRIGLDKVITDEWVSFLLEQNLNALIIHGRTAKEMSKVPAHWDEIAKAVKLRNKIAPETLIIGNGDVKNYFEATEKYKEFGVDGVMIGRGIFSNPWAFEKTKIQHTTKERIDLLLKHTKLYNDTWKDTKNFDTIKRFFKVYVSGFRGADDLRQALMLCKDYEQVEKTIAKWPISFI